MNIKYTITFHNEWHCGSGLAAGADVDALVVKDHDGLPFVPGKTIKGLVREALQDIYACEGKAPEPLTHLLGIENDNPDDQGADDKWQTGGMKQGCAFFTNATLPTTETDAIKQHSVAHLLYRSISSTAIDTDGVADDHSLRKTQVTVPCTLEGEILNVPEALAADTCRALRYIKRMGQNRSRGYGRCDINPTVQKGGDA
ncbi:MAG: CRISPR-associated protein [Muribaculaceae bacterium]|nr:CRISPR-associated protein [Muribaculaceae bacterium]